MRVEEHVIQSLSSDLEEGDGVALLQHVHNLAGKAHGVLFGFWRVGKCPCVSVRYPAAAVRAAVRAGQGCAGCLKARTPRKQPTDDATCLDGRLHDAPVLRRGDEAAIGLEQPPVDAVEAVCLSMCMCVWVGIVEGSELKPARSDHTNLGGRIEVKDAGPVPWVDWGAGLVVE